MRAENGKLLGESPQRPQEGVELAARDEFIQSPETVQDPLLDLAVNPRVIDDEQIDAGTVGLSAYKQMARSCVISILTGTDWITSLKWPNTVDISNKRDTRI